MMEFLLEKPLTALGLGALLVVPVVGIVARPVAKALIGSGVRLYDGAASALASAGEGLSDIYAEVQAERAARGAAGSGAAGPTATETATVWQLGWPPRQL